MQVPPRRVTQPQRRFSASDLASLSRDERRRLCQVLVTERGERIVEVQSPAAYDELLLEIVPLWQSRTARVRVATRLVEQGDLDQLAERIAASGDAEGVLVA